MLNLTTSELNNETSANMSTFYKKICKYIIETSGKKATVRLERGSDIDAACGQLAGKIK